MSRDLAAGLQRLGTETAFEVLARARDLEAQGRRIIHLEIGEPDFTTPRHIIEAGAQALLDGNTHYCPAPGHPRPARGLRRAPVPPPRPADRARPGAGRARSEAIPLLRRPRDLRPGRRGDLSQPGVPDLRVGDQLGGRDAGPLPLTEESGFAFSAQDLADRLTPRTKLVILNSPANPTGGSSAGAERGDRRGARRARLLDPLRRGLLGDALRRRTRHDRRPRGTCSTGRSCSTASRRPSR